ncbi:MAG: tRNA pseudouridine(55) synthase TruB [Clostridia bacterium]|nr:tRNA pseudouridine(55) synthase TruB [Clostridia bacterium]
MANDRNISGVLLFSKPKGITSHDAVYRIRRLYGTKKVGHTGTLDPMAAGLLVMLIGRAAKAAEFLSSDRKKYIAEMTLGVTTDTEDSSGTVLSESSDIPDEDKVIETVSGFTGEISQLPPMYSAIKKDGHKLVDLARKGIEIEREERRVTVYSLAAKKISADKYELTAEVSKGTYIRTLCADIGKALGCGAVMSALTRTACGGFTLDRAYTQEDLEAMDQAERDALLIPVESLFDDLPKVVLPEFFFRLASSGNEIYQRKIGTSFPTGQMIALYGANGFFAIGKVGDFENGSAIRPVKQFVT